jgi:hypothetical protein
MDCLKLLKSLDNDLQDLPLALLDMSDKQKKQLEESMEYYLLCYPQGTGDDLLEELLSQLSEYFYPDED